ncbi:hypothetical protein GQ53DRAFT_747871 [Thozetella sp. PMI_491]|nr:hypothetical protein GQ53DRAFT_747871 [Thozetella sp. PMI_491]
MDEDVQVLVLTPFREVVEKGREALENAKAAGQEEMQKAAEKLIKEGERALKKIEPLCKKHLDEYGPNFTDALKENDIIAAFRAELNDALWEFDDFIQADEFDAEKFVELQGLSRKAAPKIHDILIRMKLEHPHPEPEPSVVSAMSHSSVSGSAPGVQRTPDLAGAVLATSLNEDSVSMPLFPAHHEEELPVMGNQAGPDLGLEVAPLQLHKKTPEPVVPEPRYANSVRPDEAPPRPVVNPWEPGLHTVIPSDVRDTARDSDAAPPEPPTEASIEDAVSPMSPTMIGRVPTFPGQDGWNDGSEGKAATSEAGARSPAARGSILASRGPGLLIDPHSSNGGIIITPEAPASPLANRPPSITLTAGIGGSPVINPNRNSRASSTNDSQASVFDARFRDSAASPVTDYKAPSVQSVTRDRSPSSASRDSFHSNIEQPSSPAVLMANWSNAAPYPPPYPPSFQPNLPPVPQELPASPSTLPLARRPTLEQPTLEIHDGLIPVETATEPSQPVSPREVDCTMTLNSSFHQFKGFCAGAKDVILGGIGVKKIKKAGFGAGNHVVAKCKECLFELDWKLVEADLTNHVSANYQTVGMGFRLRFLSKSHLAAKHVEDQLYACLFCVQTGRTIEESDATVFFSQKQLFSHLARHPHPLPRVPGLTVTEGPILPPSNNYDLHIYNPPTKSVMSGLGPEISAMPMAIATETFRMTNGTLKMPPGNSREQPLQFAVGARIVGIEFPARYNGEWAIGWADNVRAPFPLDCVKLKPPAKGHIRKQPTSSLRAVARWGRKPKDKEKETADWLKFDKGDVITGISYPYPEHWCWSGHNSKGKWGIFPQAYIEPNTLMEAPGGDRASLLSQESKQGMFTRMSIRKNRHGGSGGSSLDMTGSNSSKPSIY